MRIRVSVREVDQEAWDLLRYIHSEERTAMGKLLSDAIRLFYDVYIEEVE